FVLVAAALVGCSSSSNAPDDVDAGSAVDAHARDAAVARDASASDAGAGADADAAFATDAGADAAFVPPAGTRRLVAGPVSLVGTDADTCTNDPGATGDRWCGFVVPSPGSVPAALWVFDATRVIAGDDVRCDGTDVRCFKLTDAALYNPFMSGTSYGFQGDTLFYRAGDGTTAPDQLNGPLFAWRPGWTAGRELVTGPGTACAAPATRALALCVRQVEDATTHDLSEELSAAPLTTMDAAPLTVLDSVLLQSGTTLTSVATVSEFGFSPDGSTLAWSYTDTATSTETLRVAPLDGATPAATVASGVTSWRISNDGASWLWLRSYTDDGLSPSGTLEAAAFPGGGGVTTLAASVADFDVVGAAGVLYRVNVADQVGELRYMPDRAVPASSAKLDDGVRLVVARAPDASTVIYTRTSTAVGDDLFLWSSALAAPCTLTSTPSALRTATLMADGRVVVWASRDVRSQVLSGVATTIASCATQTFGVDLLQAAPASDGRLLFIDGAADGATTGTLRVAPTSATGVAAPGTALGRGVDAVFAPLGEHAVFFTSSTAGADFEAGLYVYAGSLLEN
ncbi:MAG TPA: hypothetical protein VH560_15010, partial [Polyangia bacterium]|nr:hypothetical protein [Polyangia bacterium]